MAIEDSYYSEHSTEYVVGKNFTLYKGCEEGHKKDYYFTPTYEKKETNLGLAIACNVLVSFVATGCIFALFLGGMGILGMIADEVNRYKKKERDRKWRRYRKWEKWGKWGK